MTRPKLLAGLLLALSLAGCDDMTRQHKLDRYAKAAAPLVAQPAGIVPFEASPASPPPVTLALLEHGHDLFHIYCAPCHSELGDGRGMVVARGFPRPPSFHSERLRRAQPRYIFDVIGDGRGTMSAFKARLSAPDRWAIVAYVHALQISQNARLSDVPASLQGGLP